MYSEIGSLIRFFAVVSSTSLTHLIAGCDLDIEFVSSANPLQICLEAISVPQRLNRIVVRSEFPVREDGMDLFVTRPTDHHDWARRSLFRS